MYIHYDNIHITVAFLLHNYEMTTPTTTTVSCILKHLSTHFTVTNNYKVDLKLAQLFANMNLTTHKCQFETYLSEKINVRSYMQ